MSMTISSKINRQGHAIYHIYIYIIFIIYIFLDLKNVEINTKIKFVSTYQPEIR